MDANGRADQADKRGQAAPTGEKVADAHYDTRRQRQEFARTEQTEEDLLELRDNDDHDQSDSSDRDEDNGGRVDRCRYDAALELDNLFDKGRQTLQDQIEHTTGFAGLDHGCVK